MTTALINVCQGKCCERFSFKREQWRTISEHEFDHLALLLIPHGDGRYDCAAFDKQARRCRSYEYRPLMCRGFPYGEACPWDGCSYSLDDSDTAQAIVSIRWAAWLWKNAA